MEALPSSFPLADDGVPEQAAGKLQDQEDIPDEIRGALADLILKYEAVNRQARIEEVRRIQRQREFYKGNQNIYWSDADKKWKSIAGANGLISQRKDNEELQRFDYVTNIYQANALISISVLTQNAPHCIFGPRDANSPQDQATAKASDDVATFIGDNNKLDIRQKDVAYHFFNDGGCSSYTYYDEDGETYGYRTEQTVEGKQAQLTPDTVSCPSCGWSQELPEGWTPDMVPQTCPQCQQPISPQDVHSGTIGEVPTVSSEQKPNGMEKIEYVGLLELVRPYYAQTLEDCPFIIWETEVPKARLRSLYPKVADKILAGSSGPSEAGASATARMARLALRATSYGRVSPEGSTQLVTFRRVWFRPWAFWELDNKDIRDKLLSMFPSGCYVAFAADTYCESRDENMDDFWAFAFPLPGDGMMREGIGGSLVDVQLRINTEENIQSETFERCIPSRFIDSEVVDFDALDDVGALPGLDIPAIPRPGQPLSNSIYNDQPGQVSPQLIQHVRDLRGEVSQFLSGNVPPLFGGSTGGNDTASGISLVKDSALGRIAIYKREMNEFYAKTMVNGIECFRKNRGQDVSFAITGTAGQLDSKLIRLEDLRGNVIVRTDANDAYPISLNQQREMFAGLLNSQSPELQGIAASPQNSDQIKNFLGLKNLKIPGEDARRKQMREIRTMLETATPVPINPLLDDHQTALQTIKDWWSTEDGQKASVENPQGVLAVLQQAIERSQILTPPPVAEPPKQGASG